MDVTVKTFSNLTYQVVKRWKVFRQGRDTRFIKGNELPPLTVLTSPYTCDCAENWTGVHICCPRGGWLLSNEVTIGHYTSGFHVLATKKDAEEYCGGINSFGSCAVKVEVMVMGLKAIGQVAIDRADNEPYPPYVGCEVYDWMYIPPMEAELDVGAQKIEDAIRYLFSEVNQLV